MQYCQDFQRDHKDGVRELLQGSDYPVIIDDPIEKGDNGAHGELQQPFGSPKHLVVLAGAQSTP